MFLVYCEPDGSNRPRDPSLSCCRTFTFIQHCRTRPENLSKNLLDVGDYQVGYTTGHMDWTVEEILEYVALSRSSFLLY